jgi:hypothetical protein
MSQRHMLKFSNSFIKSMQFGNNVPINLHGRKYFLKDKSVTNIDREYIHN